MTSFTEGKPHRNLPVPNMHIVIMSVFGAGYQSTSIPPNVRSSESTSEVEPGGTGVGSYTSTTTLDAVGTGEVVETFHFLPY